MEIAHEAPLEIMPVVQGMTDYDYALVHLFEDQKIGKKYFDFFRQSLLRGRTVILDNSIFELGKSFDPLKFSYYVELLKPSYYIIPDVLESFGGTVKMQEDWIRLIDGKGFDSFSNSIGVVQGGTLQEAVECYKFWEKNCDKIAISFDYSFYKELCPHPIEEYSFMYGRKFFIDYLIENGIVNERKPHHLLGICLPQEISFYKEKKYSFIKSIDTSNPIVHGFYGIKYENYGLPKKERMPLYKLIDAHISVSKFTLIEENIKKFKSFIR